MATTDSKCNYKTGFDLKIDLSQGHYPATSHGASQKFFRESTHSQGMNMHYVHGMPVERACELLGTGSASLAGIFQRVAGLFADIRNKLVEEYRSAAVCC